MKGADCFFDACQFLTPLQDHLRDRVRLMHRLCMRSTCEVLALLLSLIPVCARAQLPVTQLRAIYPPAAQVGATTSVDVVGQGPLEEVDRLVFSNTGLSANLVAGESNAITGQTSQQFGKFTLSVASDLPAGFYEVNAVGRHGASIPRVFWVAPRPIVTPAQPAKSGDALPALTLDSIVVDRFVAARSQRYVLALSAGQKVRIVALDARLDSRALCQLKIKHPNQKSLALSRSSGVDGTTAEITADTTGNYEIELMDSVYRGGEEFFYALYAEPIEAAPLVPLMAPWSDRSLVEAAVLGKAGQIGSAASLASLSSSRVASTPGKFINALEPHAAPLALEVPCLASGRFHAETNGEAFDLAAKKGEPLWIEVASHSLGEGNDPLLTVYKVTQENGNEKLTRLVEQDDPPVAGTAPLRIVRSDPALRFDPPEDSTYRVIVRDQLASNPSMVGRRFLMGVRKSEPSLNVVAAWLYPINNQAQAKPIGCNLLNGGSVAMRVLALRHEGLTGPVEVRCEGLPAGVTAPPIVIPADRDEGHLIFTCPLDCPSAVAPLKIIGSVANSTSDKPIEVEATPAAITWEQIPSWNALTSRIAEQLVLYVNNKDTLPVTFAVGSSETLVMARGGKLTVPVAVTRRPGGEQAATMRAQGLPAKATLADVAVDAKATEVKPEIAVAADAPASESTLWFQVETKVKFRNNPQAFERLDAQRKELEKLQADPARAADKDKIAAELKKVTDQINQLKDPTSEKELAVFIPSNSVRIKIIEAPLEPKDKWRIDVKRGTESDHMLSLKRLLGFDGAVKLALVSDKNTAGIELSAAEMAAGTSDSKCHVKVSADASVGEHSAQVKVSYKFNNQDLNASFPITINVQD